MPPLDTRPDYAEEAALPGPFDSQLRAREIYGAGAGLHALPPLSPAPAPGAHAAPPSEDQGRAHDAWAPSSEHG